MSAVRSVIGILGQDNLRDAMGMHFTLLRSGRGSVKGLRSNHVRCVET